MNTEAIVEWWMFSVLPVIWFIMVIGYIWGQIMWKLGKWKFVSKKKDTNETSNKT